MKPVKVEAETITTTAVTRAKSAKLEETKTEKGFNFLVVKSGEWLIFQFAAKEGKKPLTSRVVYDAGHFFSARSH